VSNANAANAACFDEKHWEVIARGMDTNQWFNEGCGVGTGGIAHPTRVSLPTGHRYYRFASSTSPQASQLGGGWWVSFDTFKTIEQYALRNELDLSNAARLFLALPYEWTRVDRLVAATLVVPLDAYAGAGKVATTAADKWTPMQHLRVTQLYIPGLVSNSTEKNLYHRAWSGAQVQYVATRQAL
jgi:hypothetical protein